MQGMIVGGIIVLALLYVVRKARQAITARGGRLRLRVQRLFSCAERRIVNMPFCKERVTS